jgi:hypothetical protein
MPPNHIIQSSSLHLRDELHDVSGGGFPVVAQQLLVAVQRIHLTEYTHIQVQSSMRG